ncbi:MAG: VacJ family lipoprotein [Gammaproteobacteria bacterium]
MLRSKLSQFITIAITALFSFLLSGCATGSNPQDPYEGYNRKVFKFNKVVDSAVYRPVAQVYSAIIPKFVRIGVSNVLSNIAEVPRIGNDILQANPRWAVMDTGRLVLNSTLGLAGLVDVASNMGLEKHSQDFGLTLARWGYTDSSYLLVPFLPPSTPRDFLGLAGDYAMTPWTYVRPNWIGWSAYGLVVVDKRASFLANDKLIEEAFDPYLFLRDAYFQNRKMQIEKVKHPFEEETMDQAN